jgi:membrane-bound lytic murein transglycosylase B
LKRSFFGFLFIFLLTSVPFFALAQTSDSSDPCNANVANESHAELQADLDACTADIAKWNTALAGVQKNSATYETEVAALTAKIKIAQDNINAKTAAIASLGVNIVQKQSTINALSDQIGADQDSLADLLRKTRQIDQFSLAEVVLSSDDLSGFFSDVEAYAATQKSLETITDQLNSNKTQTQAEKDDLQKQKDATTAAKAAIEQAKASLAVSQAEQKTLLTDSQNQEKAYSLVIADKQAKAAQIRAALFNLRDTAAIPFGTALTYAQAAQQATGVDPAFLLAIMTQESNLGQNVGSCYVTDPTTGNGIGANTGSQQLRVMNPTRDVPVFQDILSHVGGEMATTRVSCWQPIYDSHGSPIGWGGAMGPAQFIPSTWKLFVPRLTTATGDAYPNPWDPKDAFFASALYLSDLGAGTGNYTDEKNAACKYYSGSSCKTSYANNYGASVMAKAASIQTTMIDPLQGV